MEYHYADLCVTSEDILNSPYVDLYAGKEIKSEYNELCTVLGVEGDFGISSVVFDKSEELFWMGNQGGHVTSYYGSTMQKYTSFPVHTEEEVRSLITLDAGIFALTKTSLRHHIRRGLPKFTHRSEHMVDMQCLLAMDESRVVMGGHQNKLIDMDLNTLQETKQHSLGSSDSRCAILRKHSYHLVAGDPSGRITLRDPLSLRSQHVLDTHSACLSDLDVQGNLIVTCGFSNHEGGLSCDNVVLVYDVRALRPLPPTPVCVEPLLLRFLPSVSSRLAVLSADGQVQLINLMNPESDTLTLFQVNSQTSQCSIFDISATSQAFGFGDHGGNLHLFSAEQNTEPMFNNFSRETEFADVPEELPFVSYDDTNFKPSSIKMPPLTTGDRLLSHWPDKFKSQGPRPVRLIDPEVLRTMKMKGNIGYAPNPGTFLRNQVNFEVPASPKHGKVLENSSMTLDGDSDLNTFIAIPKRYRKMEVRYCKLGNNDFDFEQFNKTGLPGLEATLPNSYCNAMLQVLYYTHPVKRALLKHTCSKEFCLSCELGFLFRMLDTSPGTPCQASNFLRAFRTVPEASALGLILSDRNPEARMKMNLGSLIQSWNRFILHQMHYEILDTRKKESQSVNEEQKVDPFQDVTNRLTTMTLTSSDTFYNDGQIEHYDEAFYYDEAEFPAISSTLETDSLWKKRRNAEERDRISLMMDEGAGDDISFDESSVLEDGLEEKATIEESCKKPNTNETEISRLFGTKQLQVHRCLKCTREEQKESIVLLCNLSYPNQNPVEPASFTDILRASLCPRKTTPAWCEGCCKFTPTLQCCTVKQLPQLLAVNCGLTTQQEKDYWQKQMDFMISGPDGNIAALTSPVYSNKPCRYGQNCSKPACKFKHPDDPPNRVPPSLGSTPPQGVSTSTNSNNHLNNSHHNNYSSLLYSQFPWLPLHMLAKLETHTSHLTITRTDSTGKEEHIPTINGSKIPRVNGIITNNDHSSEKFNHVDDRQCSEVNNGMTSSTLSAVITRQYSLSAVVCHVEDQHKNIVAMVKMNSDDKTAEKGGAQWYVFNDFCVSPITTTEVNWFNLEWKTPCVLFYESESCRNPTGGSSSLNGSASLGDVNNKHVTSSTNGNGDVGHQKNCFSGLLAAPLTAAFTPLASHEMPKAGELVGMDAEFVTLNQGEAELRSDGRLNTLKPSHLAVARITCVRGQGPLEGTPFIDDYISTQEQVVDYLTKFSGIKPGDLDANFSSKHLTTLKSTYQKLRYLVDCGVIFVGHGLKNDFRVINLVVPPEQVIDTVQLFHLPHQRMVSLKFLAWHLLDTKIQSDTHDSIEDARTALQLYRRYLELETNEQVTATLKKLYETGKTLQWKVPEDD